MEIVYGNLLFIESCITSFYEELKVIGTDVCV